MTINPKDLPEFGSIVGNFVPTEGGKIVIPKEVTADSPLNEIETPDQIEEKLEGKVDVSNATDASEPEGLRLNLSAKYPDWEADPKFQIEVVNDLIKLNIKELFDSQEEILNLEILLSEYKLWASVDDLNRMRWLMSRIVNLVVERGILEEQKVIREQILEDQKALDDSLNKLTEYPPEPEGFFAKHWPFQMKKR